MNADHLDIVLPQGVITAQAPASQAPFAGSIHRGGLHGLKPSHGAHVDDQTLLQESCADQREPRYLKLLGRILFSGTEGQAQIHITDDGTNTISSICQQRSG